MVDGLSAAPIPASLALPYADAIGAACVKAPNNFPPCLAYAIGWRETIRGRAWLATLGQTPANAVSPDGGHGIFQLTSWVPNGWDDPGTNAYWAVARWLAPNLAHFAAKGLTGESLVKATAAAFNAGVDAVEHQLANGLQIDHCTTHQNYGFDVWTIYQTLLAGGTPSDQEATP
jgi:hypothetical protein